MKILLLGFSFLLTAMMPSDVDSPKDDSLYSVYVKKSSENKKLIVRMENMHAINVDLTIIDPNGGIIHKDRINTKSEKMKKYDLNRLEPGTYTMIVDDLMKVEKVKFVLTDQNVNFATDKAEVTYKPIVWLNNDKTVDFNLLTLGKSAEVSIKSEEKVLYYESFTKLSNISKKYNLKELPSGKYTMVVRTNGETFYRYLYL